MFELMYLHQLSRVRQLKRDAATAEMDASLTRSEVEKLRESVMQLALINQALWELVRERLDLTDEELKEKASEIDLREGNADGQQASEGRKCPQCGRVMYRRHAKCFYCGAEGFGNTAFDDVGM